MIKITNEQLQKDLAALFDCQAFELYTARNSDGTTDHLIPYMMNDALECYLLLKNSTMTGDFLPDCKEDIYAQIMQEDSRNALIIHQGAHHVFTIWFESVWKIQNCYQYHSIGHFWVNGQEQWRQLVYIIGTLCDKYDYFGKDLCNETEMELLPLISFAPFRMWSPIHESLDRRYSESSEGARLMYLYATLSGHTFFAALIRLYMYFPLRPLANLLGKMLTRAGMEDLYQIIYDKVCQASSLYPNRDYGPERNARIRKNRSDVTNYLHQNGFVGDYPCFYKNFLQITAVEEHPFTITDMEFKNFDFRIQFMVSECNDGCTLHNAGFFRHPKRSGKIVSNITTLFS